MTIANAPGRSTTAKRSRSPAARKTESKQINKGGMKLLGWVGAGMALAAGAALLTRSSFAGRDRPDHAGRNGTTRWRGEPIQSVNSIIIDAPAEDLYRWWRDLEKLPRFMHHLDRVEQRDQRHSRWTAKGPVGLQISWEAEIIEDKPGELLAWRSLPGSDVHTFGRVEFRATPGGRGTKVRVETRYALPLGRVGATAARLFAHAPEQEIQQSLRTLKQAVETGEILRSDSAPGGPARPAQPNPEFARAQIDTAV
jgi:uncharacterized membrane protein